MDKYKKKWTPIQERIFRFLCVNSGKSFNLREIARSLKVSPTAVSNSVFILNSEELIHLEKSSTMNVVFVSFNRDNDYAINLKRIENLKLFYESKIDTFLSENFPGCTIILFGSFSWGMDVFFEKDDERNSDVDIAVIGSDSKEIDLNKFEKILEKEIRINFYDSWKEIHENLKNNILNGIVISGGINL